MKYSFSAVIMAGGMGSRFGSPKQLEPLGPSGELLIEYAIYDALRAGFKDIVLITRKALMSAFEKTLLSKLPSGIVVHIVFQDMTNISGDLAVCEKRKKPWGTGHALLAAKSIIQQPFIALNADDFYGQEAFAVAARFLEKKKTNDSLYGIVSYRLNEVLSHSGGVSRGVCRLSQFPYVEKVDEFREVVACKNGTIEGMLNGKKHVLSGNEWVSMGMTAFDQDVMHTLEKEWTRFFKTHGKDLEREYLIGEAISRNVQEGCAKLELIESKASWFGVTYQEEVSHVRHCLSQLHQEGTYPPSLWTT